MTADDFDQSITQLGVLSENEATADAFMELYKKLLNETYTEMMHCKNADKVMKGLYTLRGKMLQTILHRQVKFFGGTIPHPKIGAVRGVQGDRGIV